MFLENNPKGKNPDIAKFMKNTQVLSVVNSSCTRAKGNCRGTRKKDNALFPLSKRKTNTIDCNNVIKFIIDLRSFFGPKTPDEGNSMHSREWGPTFSSESTVINFR